MSLRQLVCLVCMLASFGCNAVLGIEEASLRRGDAGPQVCVLNSDCELAGDICVFRVCSMPCDADLDCERGERCLRTGDSAACVESTRATCDRNDDCPEGSRCIDETCRNECSTSETGDAGGESQCLSDQVCVAGVCRGSDPKHDPNGMEADAGDSGAEDSGMPTCEEGALQCDGNAGVTRSVCTGGEWKSADACEDGQLCDTTAEVAGTCADIVAACVGREPNESFCDEQVRTICGIDLTSVETKDCDSIQHCNAGTGSECGVCLDNEYQCVDDELRVCKADHTGFEHMTDCTDEPCNAEAGACTSDACLPDQLRCEGDVLELCNDDQSAFETFMTCGTGLCDSANLQCDVCISNTESCESGTERSQCTNDGQMLDTMSCDSATPHCIGDGDCVECTETSQCPTATCYDRSCNTGSGECGLTEQDEDEECGSGYVCDGDGNCVQCNNADQCSATGECYTATCASHTCGQTPKATTARCNSNSWYCNGSGTCVVCNVDADCPDPGECYTRDCTGANMCTPVTRGSGATCSTGGTVCNGSGTCVQCVSGAQCLGAASLCRDNSCVDPDHNVGWPSIYAGNSNAFTGTLYAFRLPQLSYPATLKAFGAIGNVAVTAKMALYADNGSGAPTGSRLAETVSPLGLLAGSAQEQSPNSEIPLSANTTYWIAIRVSADASLRSVAHTGSAGHRYSSQAYGDPWATLAGAGTATNNVDWNLYISVEDTQ